MRALYHAEGDDTVSPAEAGSGTRGIMSLSRGDGMGMYGGGDTVRGENGFFQSPSRNSTTDMEEAIVERNMSDWLEGDMWMGRGGRG